ncbi:protein arginine methyltransferase NDUFAF7, mitochondrial [Ipomoea triloba]|uniref:protein arginine methyltransferase NDUFAF7, mitochondrial n=1 Tax=Ipomoea triloba TaxID=35885 RepID=UPI00125E729C|nr:protein arginine methyltransferase NDUFAF7, mitochondrial [Ipomoea triloba]
MLRSLLLRASTRRRFSLAIPPSLSLRRCSSRPSGFANGTFVEQLEDANAAPPPSAKISVDRSGLYNVSEHSHEPSSDSELVKHLKSIIKFRGGPISVAEYMEEVLTNPKAGFYINRDVFGAEGDFITSPEVSQMFGEMMGVWAMCLWEQMGQPSRVNLVELGPGRGTLVADLLRGTSKFKHFTGSLHVHMVECSPTLQKLQYQALKCQNKNDTGGNAAENIVSTIAGTPVSWHATLEQVPTGSPTIIIAHEFYDALPVHQFQRASHGWCEKMVDITENSMFRFVLSPHPTPSTLYLMKRCKWAENEEIAKLEQIEVCPKAMDLTRAIADRIGSDGGGALIIDYGLNGIVSDSLQAIRKHKFVDILDNPGTADLSAYVDFPAIRHSAEEASENVCVHGPITQSQLLGSLGINFRVEALMENCTDEQAESLRTGYWRLVGDGEAPFWEGPEDQVPIGMGTRYLAMAIVNKNQGVPIPFQ